VIEKIGPIRNPLTIIAIFAGVAEISGTVVLPFVDKTNQPTFMWFLIAFPSVLVLLFFITLNFNHRVLYAPSDYQNEENFFRLFEKASHLEKARKLRDEIELIQNSALSDKSTSAGSAMDARSARPELYGPRATINRDARRARATYLRVEDLVFAKLQREFPSEIRRGVKLGRPNYPYVFDGVVRHRGTTLIIEVKYVGDAVQIGSTLFRESMIRIRSAFESATNEDAQLNVHVLFVIVSDARIERNQYLGSFTEAISGFAFSAELRSYSLSELESN
jgi:hypothetical protein